MYDSVEDPGFGQGGLKNITMQSQQTMNDTLQNNYR